VLVVEDEPLIALDLVDAFEAAGATVLPAARVSEAIRIVGSAHLDAAVVDLHLGDGFADAVCDRLDSRKVPFIIHSGDLATAASIRCGALIQKPITSAKLVASVVALLS
jgi:DNA-binding response OmpR family regulator